MKTTYFFSLLVILLSTLFLTKIFAEDYTQFNLPDGAKARLGKGEINDIQLSSDNTRLAVASSIGVWLYDLHTGSETALLTGHTETVMHVAFSPDGKILASSARDETIRLWNTETGESLLSLSTPPHPIHLKFSTDGKTLISQNWNDTNQNRNDTVSFWDITTGKRLNRLSPNRPKIRLGKDGILPLAADAFVDHTGSVTFAVGKKDGTISIHDGHTGRKIRELIVRTDDSSTLPIQPPRPYTYKDKIIEGLPFMRWVSGLNFSPDGKTLVSIIDYREARWYNALSLRGGQTEHWDVERDGSLRLYEGPMQLWGPIELWDVETGEQLTVLPAGIGVEFLGDGKTLAIIDREHAEFTIWDVATRSEIAKFPKGRDIRFSGDGKTLAIINNDGYAIWDIATRSEIATHNPIVEWFEISPERFMLSQDGTLLVTADEQGTVAVRETKNAKQLHLVTTGYTKPFTALAFSHDGKTIASGDSTSNIQLWDTHTGTKQNTIKAAAHKIAGLAFATDNVTLTAVTNQEAFITDQEGIMQWDITTGKQVAAHTLPNTSISTSGSPKELVFTPNSEKLAVNNLDDLWKHRIKSTERTIDIWDITTDKPPRHLIEFVTVQGPIALTPDGSILASSSNWHDATDLWSTHTGKQIATLKTPGNWSNDLLVWLGRRHIRTYALAFTHDGETLAVGTGDKHIQLWNVTDHQHIASLEGHKYVVSELAFSPDGKTLASGDTGGKIHLWETPTHQHLTTFDGHKGYIRTLAFAPDGKTLASISDDEGTILLWNVPTK